MSNYIVISIVILLVFVGAMGLNSCSTKKANKNKNDMIIEDEYNTPHNKLPNDLSLSKYKNADHVMLITGQAKINDTPFSLAGIRQKEVDGKNEEFLVIDTYTDFVFARLGDEVKISDKLILKVLGFEKAKAPEIGKAYFKIL